MCDISLFEVEYISVIETEAYSVSYLRFCLAVHQELAADIHYCSNSIVLIWDECIRQQGKGPILML